MLPQLTGQPPLGGGCHLVWDKSKCSSSCKLPQASGRVPAAAAPQKQISMECSIWRGCTIHAGLGMLAEGWQLHAAMHS
jgi:hypothetical protein